MIDRTCKSYSLSVCRHSGVVVRLALPDDPAGTNLVHRGLLTGFGALAWTSRRANRPTMAPSGPPLNVDAVHLHERRAFAPVVEESDRRIVCRNSITGHQLTYELHDAFFDLWLEGELPDADQVALDLDVAWMDLRQDDPPEGQFNAQCPYRSEDRSLCYVYLSRPGGAGMLIAALTPAAGWRVRYGRNRAAPADYSMPMHTMLGLQMVSRFDSAVDDEWQGGPVRFGVRVWFPRDIEQARELVADGLGVPVVTAPVAGGSVGTEIAFQVIGPAAGAELLDPAGNASAVELPEPRAGRRVGTVRLTSEGFWRLRVWNAAGRGSDLVMHAGAGWLETLQRATRKLEPPPPANAEGSYWAHAMCLARKWLGPDERHDRLLADALVRVHMQGVAVSGPPRHAGAEPTPVAGRMKREDGHYVAAPLPEPHEYLGKRFSPFHLFRYERVQDAFGLVQLFLLAADAFANDEFYEQAVRVAKAHVADNIDAAGRVYRLTPDGLDTLDYTTVITPLVSLTDLVRAMERRDDRRAEAFRAASLRVADYLVRRGLDFPTEGISPHVRWTEDGSIACTALSLLYAYHHLDRRAEYLAAAGEVLDFHEAWGMDAPDVRMHGSSHRFWETQWENDGEGRAINAGHAWTLWRAEALYYWALATGDSRRLIQSFNGFETNRCKYRADGVVHGCFTPDYLPDRPRRFALLHDYPQKADRSLAFYLWPRAADTWLRTSAVVDGPAGPIGLNARLARLADGVYRLESDAPFFNRLMVPARQVRELVVPSADGVEVLFAPAGCVVR